MRWNEESVEATKCTSGYDTGLGMVQAGHVHGATEDGVTMDDDGDLAGVDDPVGAAAGRFTGALPPDGATAAVVATVLRGHTFLPALGLEL
jgi:hypothetical protein